MNQTTVPAPTAPDAATVNVASRLSAMAAQVPDQIAVAVPAGCGPDGKRAYRTITFAELECDTNRIASGLLAAGAEPGMRLVLLVRPGIGFITLVFAMLKARVTMVLIDPGLGRKNMLRCLADVQPQGFVAVPAAHAIRSLLCRTFRGAKLNVTVGRRWFWGGHTLEGIRSLGSDQPFCAPTRAADPAAIIFTSGSTGPPKGVLYHHEVFDQQVEQIRTQYEIAPGEIDLAGFPLFGLFNAAMGVTTVIPEMDFTRPARVDPRKIIEAVHDWNVTQAFGSPALWNVVGRYCHQQQVRLPTLRRVLSAGAPVPPHVLERMKAAIADDGEVHTPYGATEALPVASIAAREVLSETAARSRAGAGTCVGRRFAGIQWRVIRITDEPLDTIDSVDDLPRGEIGELIVRGPVVTREYVTRTEANAQHKIADSDDVWHRMGDVGYLDDQDRFWFCGRKSQRVLTAHGPMFTICCEAVFNTHPAVRRSALVGLGRPGRQTPVMIVELEEQIAAQQRGSESHVRAELLRLAATQPLTQSIQHVLFHPDFPVDIRHNAKIFREKLAVWAQRQLG
jgi:acyl-CoA synthetase (AMP-forming)/AMP-acid ligase II